MIQLEKTPLVRYEGPGNGWRHIWMKNETCQVSGAFKIRGVANYFRRRKPEAPVVTASTGNHGTAVALLAQDAGLAAYVFIPQTTSARKKDRLRNAGAIIREIDGCYDDCELAARHFARNNHFLFIHSFEEEEIIEGHLSLLQEAEQQQPDIPSIFIPVGGGGLLTAGLRYYDAARLVTGVEYAESPALSCSMAAGRRLYLPVSHGIVEGMMVSQVGSKVFDTLRQPKPQARIVQVSLAQIKQAARLIWTHHCIRCEMAGAAALAAALSAPDEGKDCLCILSGGNIEQSVFEDLIFERHKIDCI